MEYRAIKNNNKKRINKAKVVKSNANLSVIKFNSRFGVNINRY